MATLHRLVMSDNFKRARKQTALETDGSWNVAGSWSLSSDMLVHASSSDTSSIIYNEYNTDAVIQATLRTPETGTVASNCAGIVFRARTAADFYRAVICSDGYVRIYLTTAGTEGTALQSTAASVSTTRNWHRMYVNCSGSTAIVGVDGTPVMTYSGVTISAGAHGVLCKNCSGQIAEVSAYRGTTYGTDYASFSEQLMSAKTTLPVSVNNAGGLGTINMNEYYSPGEIQISMIVRTSSGIEEFMDRIMMNGDGLYINSLQYVGPLIPSSVDHPTRNSNKSLLGIVELSGVPGNYR